jgi:hypothetical protein
MGLPCGLFTSGFSSKCLHAFLFLLMHATCHSHLILLDLTTLACYEGVNHDRHYAIFSSPLLLPPSLAQIFLSLLLSNILQLFSYFNVNDWIFHALKTTRKMTLNSYTSWTSWEKSKKIYEFKYHTPSTKPYRTGKIKFCILLIFMICN